MAVASHHLWAIGTAANAAIQGRAAQKVERQQEQGRRRRRRHAEKAIGSKSTGGDGGGVTPREGDRHERQSDNPGPRSTGTSAKATTPGRAAQKAERQ